MSDQIITAGLILVFFIFGFIGGLQRLMHWLTPHDEAKPHNYWRTELIYVAYQAAVVGLLMWGSREADGLSQLILFDCQLLITLLFTNALTTLPAIFVTVGVNTALMVGLLGLTQWPLLAATAGYLLWLVVQERLFAPFIAHMAERLVTNLLAGLAFLGLLQQQRQLAPENLAVVGVCFVGALAIGYGYLYILRREYDIDRNNAQSIRYDGLTQALNWVTFRDELRQRCDTGEAIGLLALDIDDFKRIDETYGQKISNQVLIIVVNALKERLKLTAPGALVARTGGDVLMVIVPQADAEDLKLVAQGCQDHIHQLVMPVKDATLQVSITIGGAYRHPEDDARTLYRRANAHLIAAKRQEVGNRLVVDES